ncbi:DUF4433 domain-containing protein [Salinibacter sp. 10B]|uniref:DUF4433 domain-containing protein n=1 Tax=Salinibacter sp. 10B TaxID=1923971 RepID=UPI0015E3877A|nr:DUF4433 domain-containing protein [Salinibacter sp. 10B]
MTYDDLPGLHYITPIENLPSILEHGILSHARVEEIDHESVADSEVQERRAEKRVPEGRPLHEYVNLYFHARNPMMYKRRGQHEDLCVLSVHKRILKQEGVVIADRNASSKYVRFGRGADDLEILDDQWVYARDWTHPSRIAYMEHRSVKCAEVLIPDHVAPTHMRRIFVSCEESKERVKGIVEDLEVKVHSDLFFQQGHG